jgi:ATP-dependent Clp protease ATP-binding subunit ClpX
MYNIPSEDHVSKVVIDESVINDGTEPLLIYETNDNLKVAPDDA